MPLCLTTLCEGACLRALHMALATCWAGAHLASSVAGCVAQVFPWPPAIVAPAIVAPRLPPCSTDEVQAIFLPRVGGKLDAAGAEYVRDVFMKRLLVYGPRTMLWCLTGSSMVLTWVSIARMPPNGFTVITDIT